MLRLSGIIIFSVGTASVAIANCLDVGFTTGTLHPEVSQDAALHESGDPCRTLHL
jgi:hypothetical protein